eukprot:1282600-Amphidinium_carterae.1
MLCASAAIPIPPTSVLSRSAMVSIGYFLRRGSALRCTDNDNILVLDELATTFYEPSTTIFNIKIQEYPHPPPWATAPP